MIDEVDGLDLSGVPIPFLDAYPFPAFVLAIPNTVKASRPRLVSRDTDVTVRNYEDVSPLSGPQLGFPANSSSLSLITIAWSNEKWLQVTEGRPLNDLFDSFTQNELQQWIEDDDNLSVSNSDSVFILELREPAITLHLAKTIFESSSPLAPHTFCAVTSQVIHREAHKGSSAGSEVGSSSSLGSGTVTSPYLHANNFDAPNSNNNSLHLFDRTSTTGLELKSVLAESGPFQIRSVDPDLSDDAIRATPSTYRAIGGAKLGKPSADGYHSGLTPGNVAMNTMDDCWAMVNSVDWSKTKLGPRSSWPEAIDSLLSVVFATQSIDALWLGEDLHLIYNKTYSRLVDHPAAFGRPGKAVWAPAWEYLGPLSEKVKAGQVVSKENDFVPFKTHGNGRETESYFSWRYVPIKAKDGKFLGILNQAFDTTDAILADRRLTSLRDLSEQLLVARTRKEYYSSVGEVLSQNPKDLPFVVVYSVKQLETTDGAGVRLHLNLETSVGVPEGHDSVQQTVILDKAHRSSSINPNADRLSSPTLTAISHLSSGSGRRYATTSTTSTGRQWPILKALSTRQCVVLEDCSDLISGFPVRIWEELPISAVVVPICSEQSSDVPDAVMIVGLNIKRPFDQEYDSWLHLLRAQMASTLLSVQSSEAELKRLDDAEKMEKAKAAWFRGAAYDLRSPLTLITGPIQDLLDTTLSPHQREQVQTAKRNVDKLTRLINSLMEFSRLEAGRVTGKFVPVNLNAFISDLAGLFRPAIERMRVLFSVELQPYDKLVWVDTNLFETAISNLIGNALKYTDKGSITINVTYNKEYAEIAVIDTGVGVPQAEISLVTEWFHRASNAIHAGTQATGLALALSRELLKLHGGELVVQSQTATESGGAHGSVFTARIPLAPKAEVGISGMHENFGDYGKVVAREALTFAREDRDNDAASSSNGGGSDSMTGESSMGSGSKFDVLMFDKNDILLVVDDNADIRDYIRKLFVPYCKVVEAANGEDALEKIRSMKRPPHLVLTDVMMPKMDGMELLAAIREDELTKITPTIMLSALSSEEARVDALLAGADDYVEKPFKPKELLARVHLHMQIGKKRAKLERMYADREAQITVLSDYCPSGIMRATSEGALTYGNDSWRITAGMPEGTDPDTWPSYCEPEEAEALTVDWLKFLQGTDDRVKLKWRWKNGNVVSGLFFRLDMMDPNLTGVLGCVTDITHEEQRVLDAQQRQLEAEESRQQQELLIDLTSHEIRTPVSAILQCSSLVKENLIALKDQLKWSATTGFKPTKELLDDLEEDVEALESIYQCGLVQERIAGDVLSLARIQLDMLSLYDIEMELKKEARKVISVFSSEAKMKKIELALKFGQTLEQAKVYSIKTDPVRLGQVVTNLISNAIRFTASSAVRRIETTYEVSFRPPDEGTCALPSNIGMPAVTPAPEDTPIWLFVSVKDTGPGLSPSELAMLFKRFSQSNKMIHTRYGGSGLGLFICRKITELLGGRIEVISSLGEGSTFRFFIKTRTIAQPTPLAALVEPTSSVALIDGPSRSNSASTIPSVSALESRSMTRTSSIVSTPSAMSIGSTDLDDVDGFHILIVEDNIINQTVLKRQLVKAGLTCDVANNGLEALNLIREADRQSKRGGPIRNKLYNVVLMDLEMPVMDGLTAIREIRAAERSGTLGRNMVVALTGNARQGQIDQAIAAGMDDVVIKPYVLKNLLKKIKLMSSKRAELEERDRESLFEPKQPSPA